MEHTSSTVGATGVRTRSTVRTSAALLPGNIDRQRKPAHAALPWALHLSNDLRDPEFWGLCVLAAMLMLFA